MTVCFMRPHAASSGKRGAQSSLAAIWRAWSDRDAQSISIVRSLRAPRLGSAWHRTLRWRCLRADGAGRAGRVALRAEALAAGDANRGGVRPGQQRWRWLRAGTTCAGSGAQRHRGAMQAVLQRLDNLTPRERDVLLPLVQGYTNREMAEQLGISVKTVDLYRSRVMKHMQAQTLADLVGMAIASNLVDPLALRGVSGGA